MPQDQIVTAEEREKSRILPAYSLHLDLIRGLAALVVLYGHLHLIVSGHGSVGGDGRTLDITTHPADATALPHAAVVVFFVLSGYLVGGSVLRDLKRDAFSWSSYSVRRLTRLWTVLIPALLLGSVLDLTTQHFFSATQLFKSCIFTNQLHGLPSLLNFSRYLFFFQTIERFPAPRFGTNGALWSLSSEFWYYVLFPFLAIALTSVRAPKALRIAFALFVALILWFVGSRIGFSFPVWLLGAVAYVLPPRIPARLQKPVNLALTLQFLLVLYILRSQPMTPLLADALLALSFTLLLYGILHRTGPAKKSFYSRLAHSISLPSYTLYASHIPIALLSAAFFAARFPALFRHTGLAMAVVVAPVLIYVVIAYLLFERNTDTFRRFIERRLPQRKASHARPTILASR